MYQSVEGIYRDGKVELLETTDCLEGTKVIVTFIKASTGSVDLSERGLTPEQAANLRARLQSFAEDWESLSMDAYDALIVADKW
jgi:hypothetical protein